MWKLDDPATLRAEQAERAKQAAEAAAKKVRSAIERLSLEHKKLNDIKSLPTVQVGRQAALGMRRRPGAVRCMQTG